MTEKIWTSDLLGIEIRVDHDLCNGCAICKDVCLTDVFEMVEDRSICLIIDNCTECCACVQECPENAIMHSSCHS